VVWTVHVALPDGKAPSCLVCESTSQERCESTGVLTECPFDTEVRRPTTPPATLLTQSFVCYRIEIVMIKHEIRTYVRK